jgi:membrane-bound metal-dependent hydrolase YbcI (DUF457 family)
MYSGHFAAGLALKARKPEAPTWAILLGAGLLDLLFGPFVLLGIERVVMTPGVAPGFSLEHIDWSHSLAMSIAWSVLFGLLFLARGGAVAAVLGFAVFSHFLLDLPMHPPDLALWPGAESHLGLGLWKTPFWWWLELAFIALCWWYYRSRGRALGTFAGRAGWALAVLLALHALNSPWATVSR